MYSPLVDFSWDLMTKLPSLDKIYSYNEAGDEDLQDCRQIVYKYSYTICCLLLSTFVYYCLLLSTIVYYCLLLSTIVYYYLLLSTTIYYCPRKLDDSTAVTILLAGTSTGSIYVLISGYLLCARLSVSDLLGGPCTIVNTVLASNLKTFSCIVKQEDTARYIVKQCPGLNLVAQQEVLAIQLNQKLSFLY